MTYMWKVKVAYVNSRLLPFLCLSHMDFATLQEVLTCIDNDINHEQLTKRVFEVLLYKAYPGCQQSPLAADAANRWQFAERAYELKLLKVVAFDRPSPQVIVYLDLKREECSRLFPSGWIFSHSYFLAGQEFRVVAGRVLDEESNFYSFGLYVELHWMPGCSKCVTLDCELAARRNPSGKFVSQVNKKLAFHGDASLGWGNIFEMPWSRFIANNNLFIDGVLHLRADLTVVVQLLPMTTSSSTIQWRAASES
ncbi:hypothetical protein CFC21_054395 [Triticum aestivum]|uniref:MATH domain-containing protein n=2 Tax=Triticum aestivum TaxID=4565 RepID=A0A3B6I1H1_WHEAT|nr:hypothetical protein CFC21_054395 [Triticum aestivum]